MSGEDEVPFRFRNSEYAKRGNKETSYKDLKEVIDFFQDFGPKITPNSELKPIFKSKVFGTFYTICETKEK